jgi:ABC-type amino acid transport substrate-binding protein
MLGIIFWGSAFGADLSEIKKRGVLRHLGAPYANFVTGSGDGLDVELIKRFAEYLGVKYEYVKANWENVIGDLAGKKVEPNGSEVTILGETPVRGDLIANGLTIIPWRQKVVDYSTATFPTQIWLVARADSTMKPIESTGKVEKDVAQVKELLKGHSVLGKAQTCLDPSLYGLEETGAEVRLFSGNLNEMVPAIIKGEAEATISDGPDALINLEKWPGKIKVIGPVSSRQEMGVAFAKTSSKLREAFNRFFEKCKADGTYRRLVKKYYPAIFIYYPTFFEKM